MTHIVANLLPSDILTQPWFLLFATFVGFNTMIYAGITFVKLIPLPKRREPSRPPQQLP